MIISIIILKAMLTMHSTITFGNDKNHIIYKIVYNNITQGKNHLILDFGTYIQYNIYIIIYMYKARMTRYWTLVYTVYIYMYKARMTGITLMRF